MMEAVALLEEGRQLLEERRLPEAEVRFRKAAQLSSIPAAINNWALCRHEAGEHAAALEILTPLLDDPDPLPFTRALAAHAEAKLGRESKARSLLRQAIRDFDRGLADPSLRPYATLAAWVEYTLTIKRAAATLGEHRLILDLHGRWPGRDIPEGTFIAGVAAFNLRRFTQAARHWRRIAHPGWRRLATAYALVAERVGDGTVPPFPLEYREPVLEALPTKANDEEIRAMMASGALRMRFLALVFGDGNKEAPPNPASAATVLVAYGGDWGVELGRRFLAAGRLPLETKFAAAQALRDRGVFGPSEPIPAIHEGRPVTIVSREVEFETDDAGLERQYEEAIRLRDAGERDEAYEMLSEMQLSGKAYPPAVIALANLMRERGELNSAQSLLETLEQAFPDHPAVLFNLGGLWLERGNRARAREYFERIDPQGQPDSFRRKLEEVRQMLVEPEALTAANRPLLLHGVPDVVAWGDSWREEIEERAITTGLTLRSALRRIPVQWLDAAAALHAVPPVRRRREREELLAEALLSLERLRESLATLESASREALRFVLERGGWCRLGLLTRRFGRLDGDSFWWDEHPPTSPVGRLRALGLVFVGRALVGGRRYKVAVVPVDLRSLLAVVCTER